MGKSQTNENNERDYATGPEGSVALNPILIGRCNYAPSQTIHLWRHLKRTLEKIQTNILNNVNNHATDEASKDQ